MIGKRYIVSDKRLQIILATMVFTLVAVFFIPAISQDLTYHQFADDRLFAGVSNFWNVSSNVAFILVGLLGIATLLLRSTTSLPFGALPIYTLFFVSLILVGLGSGHYHLAPNNSTLLWDRLPMTLAFMAFFSAIVGEYISYRFARRLLIPLVVLGGMSVVYWAYTESINQGDLRFYMVIQFLPMLLIPLILFLYKGNSRYSAYIWMVLAWYVLSKILEFWDQPIYDLTGSVSGHALKHVAAAVGTFFFYLLVRNRLKGE